MGGFGAIQQQAVNTCVLCHIFPGPSAGSTTTPQEGAGGDSEYLAQLCCEPLTCEWKIFIISAFCSLSLSS